MNAVNLAVAMSLAAAKKPSGKRVALVDLHFGLGVVDLMLNLAESKTGAFWNEPNIGHDSPPPNDYLTVHQSSGLSVWPVPGKPIPMEPGFPAHVKNLLQAPGEDFDFVILDTVGFDSEITRTVLDVATSILLVSTADDLLSLHRTRTAIQILHANGIADKAQLVFYRRKRGGTINLADAVAVLGRAPKSTLPQDESEVVTSVNEGKPFVLSNSMEIGYRIHELALQFPKIRDII